MSSSSKKLWDQYSAPLSLVEKGKYAPEKGLRWKFLPQDYDYSGSNDNAFWNKRSGDKEAPFTQGVDYDHVCTPDEHFRCKICGRTLKWAVYGSNVITEPHGIFYYDFDYALPSAAAHSSHNFMEITNLLILRDLILYIVARPPGIALCDILPMNKQVQPCSFANSNIGKFTKDSFHMDFEFFGDFECANLRDVISNESGSEVKIFLKSDTNTLGFMEWFCFGVKYWGNTSKLVDFTIENLRHQPFDGRETGIIQKARIGPANPTPVWENHQAYIVTSQDVAFSRRSKEDEEGLEESLGEFGRMRFSYVFSHSGERVMFGRSASYSFTILLNFLEKSEAKLKQSDDAIAAFDVKSRTTQITTSTTYYSKEIIGGSRLGLAIFVLEITSPKKCKTALAYLKRKVIVMLARQHSSHTRTSILMEKIIDFLLSNDPVATAIKNIFIFKIIPMVNPDGVVVGNSRTNISGSDLNRCWLQPDEILQPELFGVKQHLMALVNQNEREIFQFIDIEESRDSVSNKTYLISSGSQNKSKGKPSNDVDEQLINSFCKIIHEIDKESCRTDVKHSSVNASTARRVFSDQLKATSSVTFVLGQPATVTSTDPPPFTGIIDELQVTAENIVKSILCYAVTQIDSAQLQHDELQVNLSRDISTPVEDTGSFSAKAAEIVSQKFKSAIRSLRLKIKQKSANKCDETPSDISSTSIPINRPKSITRIPSNTQQSSGMLLSSSNSNSDDPDSASVSPRTKSKSSYFKKISDALHVAATASGNSEVDAFNYDSIREDYSISGVDSSGSSQNVIPSIPLSLVDSVECSSPEQQQQPPQVNSTDKYKLNLAKFQKLAKKTNPQQPAASSPKANMSSKVSRALLALRLKQPSSPQTSLNSTSSLMSKLGNSNNSSSSNNHPATATPRKRVRVVKPNKKQSFNAYLTCAAQDIKALLFSNMQVQVESEEQQQSRNQEEPSDVKTTADDNEYDTDTDPEDDLIDPALLSLFKLGENGKQNSLAQLRKAQKLANLVRDRLRQESSSKSPLLTPLNKKHLNGRGGSPFLDDESFSKLRDSSASGLFAKESNSIFSPGGAGDLAQWGESNGQDLNSMQELNSHQSKSLSASQRNSGNGYKSGDIFDKFGLSRSTFGPRFLLPKMDLIKLKNPFIPTHEEISARYSKNGISNTIAMKATLTSFSSNGAQRREKSQEVSIDPYMCMSAAGFFTHKTKQAIDTKSTMKVTLPTDSSQKSQQKKAKSFTLSQLMKPMDSSEDPPDQLRQFLNSRGLQLKTEQSREITQDDEQHYMSVQAQRVCTENSLPIIKSRNNSKELRSGFQMAVPAASASRARLKTDRGYTDTCTLLVYSAAKKSNSNIMMRDKAATSREKGRPH